MSLRVHVTVRPTLFPEEIGWLFFLLGAYSLRTWRVVRCDKVGSLC